MKRTMTLGALLLLTLPFSLSAAPRKTTPLTQWKLDGQPVTVPHTWNAIDGADGGSPESNSVGGSGYWRGKKNYETQVNLVPQPGKRYFLNFEGASITADVEVNGQKAGRHEGAFGAFTFEITDLLKPQPPQKFKVAVDNRFNQNIPPVSGDFTMFGGLYRPVHLIETNALCIHPANPFSTSGVEIIQSSLNDELGVLEITTDLSGENTQGAQLRIIARKANGQVAAQLTKTLPQGTINQTFNNQLTVKNPTRWHGLDNPYLYQIQVELIQGKNVIDQVDTHWGFRTIELTAERGLLLNGKPLRLRGVNRHQDMENKGWALSESDHANDIRIMLEMGVNAWRAAHYPQCKTMYDLCDRAGILVWAEIPVVDCVIDTPEFFAQAKFQMEEMIRQHRNHPSIYVWGTSNELGNGSYARKHNKNSQQLMQQLYDLSKQLDPTRYCGITHNAPHRSENKIHDTNGQNTYPGWYGGDAPSMKNVIQNLCNKFPNVAVSLNEYGAGGSIQHHEWPLKRPKTISPWHPEAYQAYCHEEHLRAIKKAPAQLYGTFVWNMFDFGADQRTEGDHLGRNDKGLVSYDRKTPKDAFFLYQANWTTKPMVYITQRRFTKRTDAKTPIRIYTNAKQVKIFLNGKLMGEPSVNDIQVAEIPEVVLKKGENRIEAVISIDGKTIKDQCIWTLN